MKGLSGLAMVLLLAACQGNAAPTLSAPSEQVAPGAKEQADAILARLTRFEGPPKSVQERFSREVVLEALFTYSPHRPLSSGIFHQLEEERELEALGKAAVPSILKAAAEFKDSRLVMRLLLLLGRIGDPAGVPFGLQYAKTSPSALVRRAAIRSIGLIGDSRSSPEIVSLMVQGAVLIEDGMWALARCGAKGASEKYCDWVSNELRPGVLDKFPDFPFIRPPPEKGEPFGIQEPKISAYPQRDSMDLVADLINLSDLREPRVVAILIEGLRHSDPVIQHLSIELLEKRTGFKPREDAIITCEQLHNGTQFKEWSKWWTVHADHVRFSSSRGKFILE